MAATIIGLFGTRDRAEACRDDLINAGFPADQVDVSEQPAEGQRSEPGFWDRFKDWLGMEETDYYRQETARRGSILVSVNTADEHAEQAANVIERNEPLDIDAKAGPSEERREAPREKRIARGRGARPAARGRAARRQAPRDAWRRAHLHACRGTAR